MIPQLVLTTASSQPVSPDGKEEKSALPPEAVTAFRTEADKRTSEQKALVKKFTDALEQEIREAETADEKARRQGLEKQMAAINEARPRELPRAYIWSE